MKTAFFLPVLFFFHNAMAQIGMPDNEQYENLKTHTLYVEMSDTTSKANMAMAKAIRMGWTVSKLEFVTPQQMTALLAPGNFFVSLEHNNTNFNFIREKTDIDGNIRWERSQDVKNDYFYLNFWTPNKQYDAAKGLKPRNKNTIARAELYLQSIGTGNIDYTCNNIGSPGFQREFCNGLPGYIKCIFQAVSNNIRNNTTTRLKKDVDAAPGLAALKKETLLVPNYWFGPGGTMLPNEPENSANGRYINKLLESYSHPIKLVRRDGLRDMLLNATRPRYFFYCV